MSPVDLALSMPLTGLQLIEASAGTGKTYTLAGLHLRFVVEQRRAVREILAVTFTDAATQELKSRLRARLAACVALLDGGQPLLPGESDSPETQQAKQLISTALAYETRGELVRRLRLAALDVDHAPISTIHGFCRRALDEFGLLAGRALSGELVASDRDLIETAAADYWRRAATSADKADFLELQSTFKTPDTLARILERVISGTRRLLAESNGRDRAATLLHDALAHVRTRVADAKRAAGRYSHDDEIRELHDALGGANGTQLAARLHDRFPVALIDEFQDTDAQQFAIFDAIYGEHGDLILIGDPKQAIYGFRGGDVHTYLRARARVADVQTLARNFRSTPAYLHALNSLYANAGDRAFAQAGIDYQPLEPGGSMADGDLLIGDDPAQPLTFWCDEAGVLSPSNKAVAGEQLAAACASGVYDLLASGRARLREKNADGSAYRLLQPADIAVLVATNDEALDIQRALSLRGIAGASVSRRSVFASEEAIELHGLLDALDDFDEARLRGALTARLFGATAKNFAAYIDEPHRWSAQLETFADWRRVWSTRGVAAMLALVFEEHAPALLQSPRGERRMTNWLQLAELAQTASSGCVGLRGLVDWLASRIAHADHENEDEQLRLESDSGRVKIYTFHKSKGLQFPIVFLPFTGMRRSEARAPYQFRAEDGVATTYFVSSGDAAKTPEALAAKQAAEQEELAESLRKLYVALTRACCAAFVAVDPIGSRGAMPALLHLLGVEDSKAGKKTKEAASGASAQLAQRLRDLSTTARGTIAISALPMAGTARLAAMGTAVAGGTARVMRNAVRDDWRIASYSRLVAGHREETRADRDDENAPSVVAESVMPARPFVLAGARFGTAFHELIEHADFSAWRDWRSHGAPPGQEVLVDRIVRRHALAADSHAAGAVLADLLVRTLNAALPFGVRLADLAPDSYRAEMPFHLALGQVDTARWLALLHEYGYVTERRRFDLARLAGLMTGVLDLVVLHEGRWWVIDYKTNLLSAAAVDGRNEANAYAPQALAAAVRDSEYDLQYLIYLTALHRWLKSRDPHYDYERDVGGALYLFVRGLDAEGSNGVHIDSPPAELIMAIDTLLGPMSGAPA